MTLEMDFLLAPIAGDHPCGEDLSFSALFDEIAEARREDDPTLDQGAWVAALKIADWPRVVDKATEALATRTKDLRLAGWLVEALAKTESFAGVAIGLDLIERLCERYWAALHPLPEAPGDHEARIGNLNWTLTRLTAVVRELPLTAGTRLPVSYHDHRAAAALQSAIERDPDDAEHLSFGKITMADIAEAVEKSGDDFYRQLLPEQTAARAAAERLAQRIDALLGAEGPNAAPLVAALDEIRVLTRQLAENAGLPLGDRPAPSAGASSTAAEGGESGGGSGPLRSRAQALAQLRQVAEFFRRTEPHSPVAYLADRAARWGEMPLHAWLRSVLKDEGALSQVEELLGVESAPKREAD